MQLSCKLTAAASVLVDASSLKWSLSVANGDRYIMSDAALHNKVHIKSGHATIT